MRTHFGWISIPPHVCVLFFTTAMKGSEWGLTSLPPIISEPWPKAKHWSIYLPTITLRHGSELTYKAIWTLQVMVVSQFEKRLTWLDTKEDGAGGKNENLGREHLFWSLFDVRHWNPPWCTHSPLCVQLKRMWFCAWVKGSRHQHGSRGWDTFTRSCWHHGFRYMTRSGVDQPQRLCQLVPNKKKTFDKKFMINTGLNT